MTKRELLVAIAEAPENATVYIDRGNAVWRSTIDADVYIDGDEKVHIVLAITEEE